MPRIELEIYYRNLFKEGPSISEQLKSINAAHVVSSEFYDIQFGRHSILYRDKDNKITIPIEHDMDNKIVIYLSYFYETNKCKISADLLKRRLATGLSFLHVKFIFE